MLNVNRKIALTAALGLSLGLILAAARADVKVQTVTHFGGIVGMGASDISDTGYLQGHNKRSESSVKFTGAVLGTMQKWMGHGGKGGNSITIYQVDQNRRFILNTDKKTYREEPIYIPPQPSQEPGESSSSAANSAQQKANDVRVVKSVFNVQDTGKSQVINGFQTHQYLLTWDLETENTKTHELGRSLLTTELWNSEDARFATARKEEAAYSQAYARLFNISMPADMAKQYGLQQLGYLSDKDIKPFTEKLSRIKGFPVVTDVKWEAGCIGNCSNSGQTQSQPQQETSSGGLSGMLSGLLAKKSDQKTQGDQPQSVNGLSTVFTSHTEVQSIDTDNLPASLFEVPAGYSKS